MTDIFVKDVMVKEVVSVQPDTPLLKAAQIIMEHNFDGVPVVDKENKLVGILTEYNLIEKSSSIHLPTFQKILENLKVLKQDSAEFQKEVKEVSALKVKDVMNNDPLTLAPEASFEEMIKTFREHHRVNPIPVIDKDKKVIGVVSRFDVLKPLQLLNKKL
ncbi:hypothetical protein A3I27_04555 [Candidatus Giovannonibacteria bacterium RIFCSPLOWO2_02_FULL_43_11b]|uniref:CBS domain-containing protein n=1 Tax=Candidatus Giovannonibacteria bacterium RIFCSPHIGHO2_12_FULL_43_15 TaxID=1798341 RepID=A0A1F5WRD4_9BACT|nr:MAG: hypothetical protein A3B97_00290 [Candidatus Giovannonibacteria bacterium RIFCSPHIGHO2_02_FULL_43_32]OGF78229.1 MAG: hypothetical protein A3F23_02250 [Candidatus Giovannonibacteria bacterium RIFCSPHIGHO2_12_FULL_43_15]OGF78375.1 MAG: hypothetical protein A3A15_03305 [Candidatus Giovannonibacteria bacterium RIFCSPLOWO2_01_FULL_43_60]OGF90299.1 MAG: hypothetical protein A3I27_04555 [Candidatus Giovannonibacteria bacterium RIFCSPLOWO2_02_FULL_43_11b]OGF92157.1 MAG: hypothetical protein A3H